MKKKLRELKELRIWNKSTINVFYATFKILNI